MIECAWCGEEVNPGRGGSVRRIVGWEDPRDKRVHFKQPTGAWAHSHCANQHDGDLALTHEAPTLFE